jgi:hypothetical protein
MRVRALAFSRACDDVLLRAVEIKLLQGSAHLVLHWLAQLDEFPVHPRHEPLERLDCVVELARSRRLVSVGFGLLQLSHNVVHLRAGGESKTARVR